MSLQAWLLMLSTLVLACGIGITFSSEKRKDKPGLVIGRIMIGLGAVSSIALAAALLPPQ